MLSKKDFLYQKLLVIQKLLNTNAHFGSRRPDSDFQPYLYGFRNEIGIINLDSTLICLRRACNLIEMIARSNGHFLFVNSNAEYNNIVQQAAIQSKQSYVNHKWTGGLLTNWAHMQHVGQHFQKVRSGPQGSNPRTHQEYTAMPSAVLGLGKDRAEWHTKPSLQDITLADAPRFKKMQKCFEGLTVRRHRSLPDCIIVCNATQSSIAIYEANRLQIPVISLVDSTISNQLHNLITYPIPANDESFQFQYLFWNCVMKTILLSKGGALRSL